MRLIDADAFRRELDNHWPFTKEEQSKHGFADMAKSAVLFVLNKMPTIEVRKWIPCSERLPEHSERYLVCALDGISRRVAVAQYLPRCKAWKMTGRMAYWKVIAWMPLPEPWEGEENENKSNRDNN